MPDSLRRRMRAARFSAVSLLAALCLGGALAAASPAAAQQVTLKPAAPPATYAPKGRAVDVLGVAPGMPADAARAALASLFGDVQVVHDNMGLADRGVAVATQTFISKMTARKDNDEISVLFATPTTGNAAVEISRQRTFFDSGSPPNINDLQKSLIEKYGAPGFSGPAIGTGEVVLLAWTYDGNTPGACPQSLCRTDFIEGLSVADLDRYERAVKNKHDLTIIAMLLTSVGDPTRAVGEVVTVSDTATKFKTLTLAVQQMRAGFGSKPEPSSH